MTRHIMHRRHFLNSLVMLGAGSFFAARSLSAQDEPRSLTGASMNLDAYKPVRLPPKENATPQLTDAERDEMEHHLHCQCGCGLDVYTCRTTDFTCTVSPRMHRDVMALVSGGYTRTEIMDAFRDVYGERVYMAPVKEGFNWVGYIAPFAALGGGAVVVAMLLKRWSKPHGAAADVPAAVDATPDELKRLQDALRSDE